MRKKISERESNPRSWARGVMTDHNQAVFAELLQLSLDHVWCGNWHYLFDTHLCRRSHKLHVHQVDQILFVLDLNANSPANFLMAPAYCPPVPLMKNSRWPSRLADTTRLSALPILLHSIRDPRQHNGPCPTSCFRRSTLRHGQFSSAASP